ncbi:MAG: hypothetical protein Q9M92_05870 [Enterobacterales bacterium]|nr:hypothetical protein [Enterobacterales bacterium]
MYRKIIFGVLILLLASCALVDPNNVRENIHQSKKIVIDINFELAGIFTRAVLHECYPKIGMSVFVVESLNDTSRTQSFTLGNDLYGGVLLIELSGNGKRTDVSISATDNAWASRFSTIVESFELSSLKPCTAFWE